MQLRRHVRFIFSAFCNGAKLIGLLRTQIQQLVWHGHAWAENTWQDHNFSVFSC